MKFRITLEVEDKWANEKDSEGKKLALSKRELTKQVDSGYIDFAGLKVLSRKVEEIKNESSS